LTFFLFLVIKRYSTFKGLYMPKSQQTPSSVLMELMDEYQLNPFSLSKELKLNTTSVRQIIMGKSRITAPVALRLAKLFGNDVVYWLNLQQSADLKATSDDKELAAIVGSISKIKKTPAKDNEKAKSGKKATLADKRKKAGKVPGAKPASRKPAAKSKK
jgi:addiction module HigA family antidote